jgi:molybdopterin/thiamine biosynthesis adenylyltransferase
MTEDVQQKLFASSALILGLSNAGSISAYFLANAGVRHIGLVDEGTVEESDVIEQTIYTREDIGEPRMKVVEKAIKARFPEVTVETFDHFDAHNADEITQNYEIVLDDLDNWQKKLVASDACMRTATPLQHLGLMGFTFQTFSMLPGKSACLRCVFADLGMEDIPSNVSTKECFGPIAAMGAGFQVTEAIKVLGRLGVTQGDELTQFDGLRRTFSTIQSFSPREDCPDCGF